MVLLDIEMPASCAMCNMTYESSNGDIVCSHTNQVIDLVKRLDNCPIRGDINDKLALKDLTDNN